MNEPQTICSLAPYLSNEKGHLYSYHLALKKVADYLQLSYTGFISSAATIQQPVWSPWFTFFPSTRQKLPYWRARKKEFFSLPLPAHACLLFWDAFSHLDLLALSASSLEKKKPYDHLCLMLRYEKNHLMANGIPLRVILKLLKRKWGSRLHLFTDSALLQQDLACLGKISLLPIPHGFSPLVSSIFTKQCDYLLWWPGEPREAKGSLIIENLLQSPCEQAKKCELALSSEASFISKVSSFHLRSISPCLSHDDYQALLHASDIILLPYSSQVYGKGTSGIFVEAICAQKIPLVTADTWMAYELKRFGLEQLIIKEWKKETLLDEILPLLHNRKLLDKLQEMSTAYRLYHTEKSFAEKMKEAIGLG